MCFVLLDAVFLPLDPYLTVDLALSYEIWVFLFNLFTALNSPENITICGVVYFSWFSYLKNRGVFFREKTGEWWGLHLKYVSSDS